MALALFDRVQETTTTTGTGAVTLAGAVSGFQSFAVVGNGNTCYYTILDGTAWEVGIGTYSSVGPSLARTTVLSNSSGTTSQLTLASGTKTVFLTYPAEKSVNLDASGNVSPLGTISSGVWQGTTVGVAYGGTGVTASSGANSVMLRDANQNVSINRLNQNSTTVTAAGGTTTLTAASTFSQILVGTGGQTFKLPDATTLTNTTTFEFNNNATGTLTITDNASAVVGTISSGGAAAIALLANGTVGGTWDVHAYIPENVTWGTNSLVLGSTVITGGTWNGGVISTAYGGTGLSGATPFTSGGALYATSASALTSGTLPASAGGTGNASYTIGDILYASGTNALSRLADVATGNALISGGVGVAPSWGKIGLTTHVSGTLAAGNGGTGISSYTVGDILYASATGTLSALADVATGNVLLSGGVGVAPSWGKVALGSAVSGNLPVTNLNSGTSASSSTYWRGDGTWAAVPSSMVYPGTGIANSTGTAWGTSYGTSGTGTTVALTTGPSLAGATMTGTLTFANATSPNTNTIQFGDNTGWNFRFMTSVAGTPTTRFTFGDNGNFTATGTISGTSGLFSNQGRFSGWYTSGSGLAAEIGISGGDAYILSYNRTSSAYGNIEIGGVNVRLNTQGGTLTGNGNPILTTAGGTLNTGAAIGLNGGTTYGIGVQSKTSSGFFDTVESGVSTDPLELVYYSGSSVVIGAGASKGLLAGYLSGGYIGVSNTSSTTGYGLALYGGATSSAPTYGIMFSGTPTFGTYGYVSGDWATYFTMNDDTTRGWIFRRGGSNVASISGGGVATFASTVNTGDIVNIGGYVNGSIATTAARGIEFHSSGDRNYWIGKRYGAWTQPLDVAFYTGIRYHARYDYGGHKFYTAGYDSNLAISIGDGDNNIRTYNSILGLTNSIIVGQVGGSTRGYIYNDGGGFGLLNSAGGWCVRNIYSGYDVTFGAGIATNGATPGGFFGSYGASKFYNGGNISEVLIQSGSGGGYIEFDQSSGNDWHFAGSTDGNFYFTNTSVRDVMRFNGSNGYVVCYNGFSSPNKAFEIVHPLREGHILRHSSVEGPRIDLIYRGHVTLVDGVAVLNMDTDAVSEGGQTMTPGTFEALTRDADIFVQNQTGWEPVRGSLEGATLTITCRDLTSTDTVSWMLIAERKDAFLLSADSMGTDDMGRLILEEVGDFLPSDGAKRPLRTKVDIYEGL